MPVLDLRAQRVDGRHRVASGRGRARAPARPRSPATRGARRARASCRCRRRPATTSGPPGVGDDLALALRQAVGRLGHVPRIRRGCRHPPSSRVMTGWGSAGARRRACASCSPTRPRAVSGSPRPGVVGEGGDRTLVIDRAAEDVVFAELERLHDAGARFTAVSEERGIVDFGDPGRARRDRPDRRVAERQARARPPRALDRGRRRPDDGRRAARLRLRRRARPRSGAPARARARGSNDVPLGPLPAERRTPDGPLEIVAVESADAALAGRGRRRRSEALRPPGARDRVDRDLAVPGGRRRASTRWRRSRAAGPSTPRRPS